MSDLTSALKKQWKHWFVYSSCLFLSLFVLLEFMLSLVFISTIAPSNFMFYFTPAGLLMGESTGAFFFTALLFLGFLIVLKAKVYVKNESSMKFNRENSHLLLPFYLIALSSLAVYIILVPLELSNLLSYVIFILLAESFAEHYHVSRYGSKIKGYVPKIVPKRKEKKIVCPDCGSKISAGTKVCSQCGTPLVERKEPIELEPEREVVPEVELGPEEKRCPDCGAAVIQGSAKCPECGIQFEEETQECSECGAEVSIDAEVCSVCGEPLKEADEMMEELEKEMEKAEKEEKKTQECPICGSEMSIDAEVCSVCGEPLKETDEMMEELEKEMERAEKEEKKTQKCPVCGAEAAIDAEECPLCGEPLKEETMEELKKEVEKAEKEEKKTQKCPVCGSEVSIDAEECPLCSEPLKEAEEEAEEPEEEPEKEAEKETLECPVCGAKASADAEVCPVCQEPLKEETMEELEKKVEETLEEAERETEKIMKGSTPQLTDIDVVDETTADKLREHGLDTLDDVVEKGLAGLAEVSDLSFKEARAILDGAKESVEKEECPVCAAEMPKGSEKCPKCHEPLKEEKTEDQELIDELEEFERDLEEKEKEGLKELDKAVEKEPPKKEAVKELKKLRGVGTSKAKALYEHGYRSIEDLKDVSEKELRKVKGIGSTFSKKILKSLEELKK